MLGDEMLDNFAFHVEQLFVVKKTKPSKSDVPAELPLKICYNYSKQHFDYIESVKISNDGRSLSGGGTKYASYNQKQYAFLVSNPYQENISCYAKVAIFKDLKNKIVDRYIYVNVEDIQPGHTLSDKFDIYDTKENYYLIEVLIKNDAGEVIHQATNLSCNLCNEAIFNMPKKEFDEIMASITFTKISSAIIVALILLLLILPIVSIVHFLLPWFVFWPALLVSVLLGVFMVFQKIAENNPK
jgi:hypothetical protein